MSAWSTPADLRAQVMRRWEREELLRELIAPGETFPLRLTLRSPTSAELSDRFDEVRDWVAELHAASQLGCRLVMRDVRHRVIGQNRLPDEAWVDSLEDALRWIGKVREARRFSDLAASIRLREPGLLPWLHRQPLRALSLADDWPRLLDVVAWLRAHPRPALYLRQVDLPGIHSKFIEGQRGVLSELLDLALPADAIDAGAIGAANFARRYGFRDKPSRVRMRFLDPLHAGWIAGTDADYTMSREAFASLRPDASRVFIVENEINFLSFPGLEQGLAVFGAGYGFANLAQAEWLDACDLRYWGDIDTHGFAILDQLRARFPHAASFLMDRDTLFAHEAQWTQEPQPTQRDLARLTEPERRVYDDLRWKRLSDSAVRLEQERIGFGWVERAVVGAARSSSP